MVELDGRTDLAKEEMKKYYGDNAYNLSINFSTGTVKLHNRIHQIIHYDDETVTTTHKHWDNELNKFIGETKIDINLITNEFFMVISFIDDTRYTSKSKCILPDKNKNKTNKKSNSGIRNLLKKLY